MNEVYGYDPSPIIPYTNANTFNSKVEEHLQARDTMLKEMKEKLVLAHSRMKKKANLHHREVNFEAGDLLYYLKIMSYRSKSLDRRTNEKLPPRYFGPYPIVERVGTIANKLLLPNSALIHPVFHIS